MQVTLRQLTGDTIDYRPLLNYLIKNIDVDEVNVEAYTHQNVNITGFRIVDPDTQLVRKYLKKYPKTSLQGKNHPFFSENAFMYDSIQVFAKALNNLDSLSTIQPMALSCDAAGSWPDGEKVLSYLKEVDHMGLSGEIRFDADGFRTDFQLDLMEKYRGRLRKTGIWKLEAGINYTMTASEIGTQMIEKLANKRLRVVPTGKKLKHLFVLLLRIW